MNTQYLGKTATPPRRLQFSTYSYKTGESLVAKQCWFESVDPNHEYHRARQLKILES
jgi:hypothetical protein